VHSIVGSVRMMLLWAQERHHGLGGGACVVNGVTGLGWGRRQRIKVPRPWLGMMVWRLRGGLDDGAEAPGRTQ
jgi:hypothetical protein